MEEQVCLGLKVLAKLELIKLDHADNFGASLEHLLEVFGILHLRQVCLKNEDARLTNLLKILLIEVWQLFLTEDRLEDVQHTVDDRDHRPYLLQLGISRATRCSGTLLQNSHCKNQIIEEEW